MLSCYLLPALELLLLTQVLLLPLRLLLPLLLQCIQSIPHTHTHLRPLSIDLVAITTTTTLIVSLQFCPLLELHPLPPAFAAAIPYLLASALMAYFLTTAAAFLVPSLYHFVPAFVLAFGFLEQASY